MQTKVVEVYVKQNKQANYLNHEEIIKFAN